MYRRSGTAKASYPCLLLASNAEQEKKTVDLSHGLGPCIEEKENINQVGVPLWAGIHLFLMHVCMGVLQSSCLLRLPGIGDTPTWIPMVTLLNGVVSGFCDHLGVYLIQPSKLEPFSKVYLPVSFLAFMLFLLNICTVLPAWESTALIVLEVVTIAAPAIACKKITGKDSPTNYSELLDSVSTWSGLMAHLIMETLLCILCCVSWKLMGCPPLLGQEDPQRLFNKVTEFGWMFIVQATHHR